MKMNTITRIASALTLALMAALNNPAMAEPVKNIVLVHGFFADGSGWQGVAKILTRDGYNVAVVQEPETSFAEDVKVTTRAINAFDGKSILVGHSYGGMVITEAGVNPKVAGLVYVSAFQPDAGESLLNLVKKTPPASDSIKATADGYLYVDPARFHADFAADLSAADARFMAMSQVMPTVQTAGAPVTQVAWKSKPSWAVITTADRTVNPELQRFMAARAGSKVVELDGSHAAFIAHPEAVAQVIEQAAAVADKQAGRPF
ncbi:MULTISPECIES: alpha/beta hydrolase [unclassified Herbaspirillum]|jgi:pimeloyl-ACP methyl ester carboxylesterase|uniref:alpha/beta fold hydrolase n=2 Tax=unclassified Herbaspirillum TaxID=2624150 RepID=UPI000E2F4BAA|nr:MULTISPECIES: alpha/beta hydrolase [unclassified Herbaspirillum]RFB71190.1 alpha/beta hydrolase [Herbaspirillum sp. 3R-3a1]TFI08273.1 alpha/beta hydrolase [Herbaspirillum sp. 3R11]TFI14688.1 alpha/beta hydrolase [Herbaspirillum sp. 3R-11]TFI31920.1 alpha/beta hydrolase [Herbaspirillum sp. 3C11]TFI31997.1 alpha/beta hydrolase [Herbaspirillum sp. 3C11]